MNRYLLMVMFVLLAAPAGSVQGKLARAELDELAQEASYLFRRANEQVRNDPEKAQELYEQALLRFERIVEEGEIANSYLYYNIANAYLLKGDVGRAVLNYRRAERFGAGGTELAKNLAFARSKRIDQIPFKAERRILRTLFFWHYDFGLKWRFRAACVGWAVFCVCGSILVWRRRRFLGGLMAAALMVTVCLAGSVAWEEYQAGSERQGVILADAVAARQGDGENYAASFKEPLHSGTEFELLERRSGWLQVELASGARAWIPAATAEII